MGKKFRLQQYHEYLKTSIYHSLVNNKRGGLTAEDIKRTRSIAIGNSDQFDVCMRSKG
jgi:hypothetical protein